VLSDLDGVVYRGSDAVPDATPALERARAAGLSVGFLTNNAARTPETVAAQLCDLGLDAVPDDVVTSPQAAVMLLADHVPAGSAVLVVGGEGLERALTDAGYQVVRHQTPQTRAVVQGFARDVTWADLAEAAFTIAAGAVWIGTNQDWTLPQERGIAPGNGTLISAVHTATGTFPEIAGKPERHLFDLAVTRFRCARPLVVGDRLDTDIEGARRAGLASALVLTGVDGATDLITAPPERRPDFLLATLADLHRPYPLLELAPNGAVCGDAAVRIDGRDVRIERGDPDDPDTIRATAQAVWHSELPVAGLRLPDAYRPAR
jgi:glycerol 3-phosphatase-2